MIQRKTEILLDQTRRTIKQGVNNSTESRRFQDKAGDIITGCNEYTAFFAKQEVNFEFFFHGLFSVMWASNQVNPGETDPPGLCA